MARIVFMGTPAFAVPSLKILLQEHQVVAVVTQPDARAGRGQRLSAPPVKEVALAHGLRVMQPDSLRSPQVVAALREIAPEVIVVVAYGQILRRAVLDIPPYGCINVHASLLPKYRGAAPIAAAILAGDSETGVTVMLMDAGMDTGPILAQAQLPIKPDDTTGTLEGRLAPLGAQLLAETLPRWLAGEIVPQPQDERLATYCRPLSREDGLINWSLPAEEIARRVRAYNPWPGAYTYLSGRLLKILKARPLAASQETGQPGQVIARREGIGVITGRDLLMLEEVQLEGKKPMSCQAFACGQRGFIGAVLGMK